MIFTKNYLINIHLCIESGSKLDVSTFFTSNRKPMKKITAIAFGLFLVLSLSACGQTPATESTDTSSETMMEDTMTDDTTMMEDTATTTTETTMEEETTTTEEVAE